MRRVCARRPPGRSVSWPASSLATHPHPPYPFPSSLPSSGSPLHPLHRHPFPFSWPLVHLPPTLALRVPCCCPAGASPGLHSPAAALWGVRVGLSPLPALRQPTCHHRARILFCGPARHGRPSGLTHSCRTGSVDLPECAAARLSPLSRARPPPLGSMQRRGHVFARAVPGAGWQHQLGGGKGREGGKGGKRKQPGGESAQKRRDGKGKRAPATTQPSPGRAAAHAESGSSGMQTMGISRSMSASGPSWMGVASSGEGEPEGAFGQRDLGHARA